jgi:hypothetical protein
MSNHQEALEKQNKYLLAENTKLHAEVNHWKNYAVEFEKKALVKLQKLTEGANKHQKKLAKEMVEQKLIGKKSPVYKVLVEKLPFKIKIG